MKLTQALKLSLTGIKTLPQVLMDPLKSARGLVGVLALIFFLPNMLLVGQVYQHIQADSQDLMTVLPDFRIDQGAISGYQGKPFVYYSDGFSFYFDPSGQVTESQIKLQAQEGAPAIGFLSDKLYLASSLSQSGFAYSDLQGLSKQDLKDGLSQASSYAWLGFLFIFILGFVFSYLFLTICLWIVVLLMKPLLATFLRIATIIPNRLMLQIVAMTSFRPILALSIMNLLGIPFLSPAIWIIFATTLLMMRLFKRQLPKI